MTAVAHQIRRVRLLTAALVVAACGDSSAGPVERLELDGEHVRLVAPIGNATLEEMEQGLEEAEAHFASIANLVGAENTPSRRIIVVLEGPKQPNATGGYADAAGTVHIYQYPEWLGGYFSLLAHEMAHSFRDEYNDSVSTWSWRTAGFIEEGFAEFVALTVDPAKIGFPFYGQPEKVITGYWVTSGQAIPLEVLRQNHDLNQPCEYQAYVQRASWFRYIDETHGRQAVLDVAYSPVEVTSEVTRQLLGVSLAELDAGWEQWAAARYAALPDQTEAIEAYFSRVPESGICVAGVDY